MGRGSWYRCYSKDTVEGSHGLDVNWLKRKRTLTPGRVSSVSWSRGDQRTGSIGIRAEAGRVVLEYRSRSGGGHWEDIEEPVRLTWTACNYGGERPWFVCPGRYCGRRVGKLYGAGTYFLCRHCYDLAYESQRESVSSRLLSKAQSIRMRLGGSPSKIAPFPDKPKRMHWRTYMRLCRKYEQADRQSWLALEQWLDRQDRILRREA